MYNIPLRNVSYCYSSGNVEHRAIGHASRQSLQLLPFVHLFTVSLYRTRIRFLCPFLKVENILLLSRLLMLFPSQSAFECYQE